MRFFISIICLALFPYLAVGQFYDSGQDPASYRWMQIRTPHFKVIFPRHIDSLGQRTARALEASYQYTTYSLNVKPGRISVILHPGSLVSNAYVGLAPRRMEFVTTPPQDNDAQDWVEQLAIHEFRHAVQIAAVNRKFTRGISWFFGEQSSAGILAAFVPFWFMEGDAVLTETLLGNSGRGRLPSFDVELRAQLLEGKQFSYDKAVYGSYRDFVPDHYVLGYHLVTIGRKECGPEIWNAALSKVAGCPIMITPFNRGIRKTSGLSKVKFYRHCLGVLDSTWRNQLQTITINESSPLTQIEKFYTKYSHPCLSTGGKLFAQRSGVNDVRRIVVIDSLGKSTVVTTPGYYAYFSLSAAGSRLAWAELSYDPRWENRNYSVIYTYDLNKNRKKKISHRSRYFAPSLSPDGANLVAVETNIQAVSSLVILDARNGKVLHRMTMDSGQIVTPSWGSRGDRIAAVFINKGKKQILLFDTSLNFIQTITPPFSAEITQPYLADDKVFFSASFTGIDNIFAAKISDGTIYQLTSARYGAYDPCMSSDGKTLIYADYQASGQSLLSMTLDTLAWQVVSVPSEIPERLFEPLLSQERGKISFGTSDTIYQAKPYRKFLHLFNPHSWGPISVNANSQTVKPGLSVMSQNKLATFFATLGWEYSLQEKAGTYYADLSFRQWYPIIDFRFDYGRRNITRQDSLGETVAIGWDETSFRTLIRVPLNLSSGKWIRWMQPAVSSTYLLLHNFNNYPENSFRGFVRSLDYYFYWSSEVLSTQKDIYPRWGQTLLFTYRHTPLDGYNMGNITALRGELYFPGIGRHHNLHFYAGWQQSHGPDLRFSGMIRIPRGYSSIGADRDLSLSANYTCPLVYPDLAAGSVFYLKRIWMTAFYDRMQGQFYGLNSYMVHSAGLEVMADIHILRFLAPFSLGCRLSYAINTEKLVPEFIYSLNIAGIQ